MQMLMQTGQVLRVSGSDKAGIPLSDVSHRMPLNHRYEAIYHTGGRAVTILTSGALFYGVCACPTRCLGLLPLCRYMATLLHEVWTGGGESDSPSSSSDGFECDLHWPAFKANSVARRQSYQAVSLKRERLGVHDLRR